MSSLLASYNSSRVQRAARMNNLESTRLQQTLRYIDQAKLHQYRLTNQDIRLISEKIDIIQSSSGHSSDVLKAEPSFKGQCSQADNDPCFMYGERIWSRKKRRSRSAFERSSRLSSNSGQDENLTSGLPLTCSGNHRSQNLSGFTADLEREQENSTNSLCESDLNIDKITGRLPKPTDCANPRQEWEYDTSEVTKKILRAQSKNQSIKSHMYLSLDDVMASQASRSVRNLIRQIRIFATPTLSHNNMYFPPTATQTFEVQSPHRSSSHTQFINMKNELNSCRTGNLSKKITVSSNCHRINTFTMHVPERKFFSPPRLN